MTGDGALTAYEQFLEAKKITVPPTGIDVDPATLHPSMLPHQRAITRWALKQGRAAIWADTGLGKSFIYCEWATRLPGRTLVVAPLGVAQQLAGDEGPKWGYQVTYARSEEEAPADGITVTNYERLGAFKPEQWPKVVLDEADILANFTGTIKRSLIRDFRNTPYKLTCTATPAPNEVVELCNQADFLGVMPPQEMLSRFFTPKGVEGSATGQYRLKAHAVKDFYRWLASWAVACKTPLDLECPDDGYNLPPLSIIPHFVDTEWAPDGHLFLIQLKGVTERAKVRRDTIVERVAAAVTLVEAEPAEQWMLWYGLLDEGRRLKASLPGSVMLEGSDSAERKADVLMAFAHGEIAWLITHPKIAGAGMNLQSCARTAFVGLSDSYRQYYQCIRRFWRFGQCRPVDAHIILSDPERAVYENVLRKESEAGDLTRALVAAMRDFDQGLRSGQRDVSDVYEPTQPLTLPSWLSSETDTSMADAARERVVA